MRQKTSDSEIGIDRRELLQGSLGFLGMVPLCCTTPQLDRECIAYEGNAILVNLKRAAALRPVGAARAIVDAGRKLNIIVAHPEKDRFVALDRSCTHGGAPCTYDHQRHTVRCTSLNHAEYDLSGALLHGRTHGNLRAYAVRRTGGTLRIEPGRDA